MGTMHRRIRQIGVDTANHTHAFAIEFFNFSGANQFGLRYTVIAPAVIPSIAEEMAKKAKWYQVITLRILSSVISMASVVNAMRKVPA
jgi:hypothetical protein